MTTTSSPSARACSTSATAVMPQSTVRTSSKPSPASRVSVSRVQAVALLEPRRQVPGDARRRARAAAARRAPSRRSRRRRSRRARRSARRAATAARDRLDRLAHVAERERVVPRQRALEERARVRGLGVAAPDEHRCRHLVERERVDERLHTARASRVRAARFRTSIAPRRYGRASDRTSWKLVEFRRSCFGRLVAIARRRRAGLRRGPCLRANPHDPAGRHGGGTARRRVERRAGARGDRRGLRTAGHDRLGRRTRRSSSAAARGERRRRRGGRLGARGDAPQPDRRARQLLDEAGPPIVDALAKRIDRTPWPPG